MQECLALKFSMLDALRRNALSNTMQLCVAEFAKKILSYFEPTLTKRARHIKGPIKNWDPFQ